MKTTKNSRAVVVGIFIFIALIIFIIGVLTLGGQNKGFSESVNVKASFADVKGLQRGSNIWLAGVKVGTVDRIAFNGKGGVDVVLAIDETARQYVHKDAVAKLGTDGLIGNKIIVITSGTAGAGTIAEGDQLQVEGAIAMDDLMATLQQNNQNILAITSDIRTVSRRLADGQGTIGKLLKEETLSNDLHLALSTLQRATQNAEQLTRQVSAYASQLRRPGSLTNDLITDTLLFARLRSSVSQIEQVTVKANEVMSTIRTASSNLDQDLRKDNTPAGVLLHDEETAANLKSAIKNLQTSTQKLDQNMEALQHNFLFRGFFRKKAKQKGE